MDDQEQEQKPVSVFQGDGVCINRILARSESSVGKSSRVFYRSNEGVPFRWEMEPGTAKTPQEEEIIPPICPSPLMQSLGLPLPNLDPVEPPLTKTSKLWRLREMVKKRFNNNHMIKKVYVFSKRNKKQESTRFSSVCDVSMVDGPFCCSPWNIPPILDEGNTRIYYCSHHKKAFAVEQDDLFLSRILSGVSASSEHFSGPFHSEVSPARVPFGWEMHPGTPKSAPENEVVPPPSPPPAARSLTLRRPPPEEGERMRKPTWKKAWFWMRRYGRKKKESSNEIERAQNEVSFRYDEGFNAVSFRKTASVSSSSSISPMTRGGGRVRRSLEGNLMRCGGPWSRRSEMLVFARRRWKKSLPS